MNIRTRFLAVLILSCITACQQDSAPSPLGDTENSTVVETEKPSRFEIYSKVKLTADLDHLSDNQRRMIELLIDAAKITDELFWQQVWGSKESLLARIDDADERRFAHFNYGPWDRLDNDTPFIEGFGPRPAGARFYPQDMTKAEFEAWQQEGKDGLYSLVRRNREGKLTLIPYHEAYEVEVEQIARLLEQASALADNDQFAAYLKLRAEALRSDDYQASDIAWMEMKTNPVEVVIGPIESYQDSLFGYRTAFETFVLIKDQAWSERLARFAKYMPELQLGLPVPEEYKSEVPGANADLNAYDLAYCAGDCNSGAKTIAINLPNDEEVQLAKGTRRLQIKNAMRAKFDRILLPIAGELIAQDQRNHVTFESFFGNTMFHEVAHGLGIKNTLDGSTTVRQALKEHASSLEEGKADVLGLYMVQKLREKGEISDGDLMDDYVTFLAGIFRSVRFGASSAHGRANMIRFNYFRQAGAFTRDQQSGTYRVNLPEFEAAVATLSGRLLKLQGDGDYAAVDSFVAELGSMGEQLQADLDRLAAKSIPVDIVYQQGKDVLGL